MSFFHSVTVCVSFRKVVFNLLEKKISFVSSVRMHSLKQARINIKILKIKKKDECVLVFVCVRVYVCALT